MAFTTHVLINSACLCVQSLISHRDRLSRCPLAIVTHESSCELCEIRISNTRSINPCGVNVMCARHAPLLISQRLAIFFFFLSSEATLTKSVYSLPSRNSVSLFREVYVASFVRYTTYHTRTWSDDVSAIQDWNNFFLTLKIVRYKLAHW